MLAEHQPDAAAVEEVFYSQNVKTALKLAHVRGVALLAIAEASVALGEYSPLEVKVSVVGYGRAEKSQVERMVRTLTGLEQESKPKTSPTRWPWPSVTPRIAACRRRRSWREFAMNRWLTYRYAAGRWSPAPRCGATRRV